MNKKIITIIWVLSFTPALSTAWGISDVSSILPAPWQTDRDYIEYRLPTGSLWQEEQSDLLQIPISDLPAIKTKCSEFDCETILILPVKSQPEYNLWLPLLMAGMTYRPSAGSNFILLAILTAMMEAGEQHLLIPPENQPKIRLYSPDKNTATLLSLFPPVLTQYQQQTYALTDVSSGRLYFTPVPKQWLDEEETLWIWDAANINSNNTCNHKPEIQKADAHPILSQLICFDYQDEIALYLKRVYGGSVIKTKDSNGKTIYLVFLPDGRMLRLPLSEIKIQQQNLGTSTSAMGFPGTFQAARDTADNDSTAESDSSSTQQDGSQQDDEDSSSNSGDEDSDGESELSEEVHTPSLSPVNSITDESFDTGTSFTPPPPLAPAVIAENSVSGSSITTLPTDIYVQLFDYMKPEDRVHLAQTCSALYTAFDSYNESRTRSLLDKYSNKASETDEIVKQIRALFKALEPRTPFEIVRTNIPKIAGDDFSPAEMLYRTLKQGFMEPKLTISESQIPIEPWLCLNGLYIKSLDGLLIAIVDINDLSDILSVISSENGQCLTSIPPPPEAGSFTLLWPLESPFVAIEATSGFCVPNTLYACNIKNGHYQKLTESPPKAVIPLPNQRVATKTCSGIEIRDLMTERQQSIKTSEDVSFMAGSQDGILWTGGKHHIEAWNSENGKSVKLKGEFAKFLRELDAGEKELINIFPMSKRNIVFTWKHAPSQRHDQTLKHLILNHDSSGKVSQMESRSNKFGEFDKLVEAGELLIFVTQESGMELWQIIDGQNMSSLGWNDCPHSDYDPSPDGTDLKALSCNWHPDGFLIILYNHAGLITICNNRHRADLVLRSTAHLRILSTGDVAFIQDELKDGAVLMYDRNWFQQLFKLREAGINFKPKRRSLY